MSAVTEALPRSTLARFFQAWPLLTLVALAWIAIHVIVSALNSMTQFAFHTVFFAILTYFLMRASASRYFAK